ncbi:MAG: allophanate hydrolase [Chitinophagaceae bacterium]
MHTFHPYSIFPLGDRALTIEFGHVLNEELNEKVLRLFRQLKSKAYPFVVDLLPAYSSLTVYYDVPYLRQHYPLQTAFETMVLGIENLRMEEEALQTEKRLMKVPVCYERSFAPDIEELAKSKNISVEEVIRLHMSKTYRVYLIGFLPGFPYMGEVDERIAMPRREQPRTHVAAGSVGIAGKQTGIYPTTSPGGWQIIGRTPLTLFNQHQTDPVLFSPGDEVQFYSITEDEFVHYQSRTA